MSVLWKNTTKMDKAFLFILLFFVILINIFTADKDRWPLDDAWILNHAVKSVSAGQETSFVDSNQWIGITSPVFFALIYIFSKVTSVINAHFFVQTVSAALYILGIYYLCRKKALPDTISIVTAIVLSTTGLSLFHLMNGLETGLAMAAVVWSLIALDAEVTPLWGYILFALLFYIRPELAALSGLALLNIFIHKKWKEKHQLYLGFAVETIVFLAGAAFLLMSSGSIFPQTASAKAYFFAQGCLPLGDKISLAVPYLSHFLEGVSFCTTGIILYIFSKQRIIAWGMIVAFIGVYIYKLPIALGIDGHRYLYILVPFCVYGIVFLLSTIHTSIESKIRTKFLRLIACMNCLMIIGYFNFTGGEKSIRYYKSRCRSFTDDNLYVLKYIIEHGSPKDLIVVMDAGLSSEVGQFNLIDFVGLKTLGSMKIHAEQTYGKCGLTPEIADKIASQGNEQPRWLITTEWWDLKYNIPMLLKDAGWNVQRINMNRPTHYNLWSISK